MKLVIISLLGGLLSFSAWSQEKEGTDTQKSGPTLKSGESKKPVVNAKKEQATGPKKIVLPTLEPLPLFHELPVTEGSLPPLPPRPNLSPAKKKSTSSKRTVNGYRVITPNQDSKRKMRWIAGKWVIGLR